MAIVTLITEQTVAVPALSPTVSFVIPVGKRIVGVDVVNLDGHALQQCGAANQGDRARVNH